jgi:hypothetical protein
MSHAGRQWRDDLNSLGFQPSGHNGSCVVHRRAFATLLGFAPSPTDCVAWFEEHSAAFEWAAAAKISRAALPAAANFHLTSRDIRRALDQAAS